MKLYSEYKDQGLEILAFPSNQFGRQEPGSAEQIKDFVAGYGVEFPMMSKIDVNGENADPVWVLLKQGGDNVGWNFKTKFIINKTGDHVTRYEGRDPETLEEDIKKLL